MHVQIFLCPNDLENRGGKRREVILVSSPEAQVVADCIEAGLSLKNVLTYSIGIDTNMAKKDTVFQL